MIGFQASLFSLPKARKGYTTSMAELACGAERREE